MWLLIGTGKLVSLVDSGHKRKKATMEETNGGTPQPLKKVMLFCDGTWCGQLTRTTTNVKILADAMAGRNTVVTGVPFENGRIVGCYFDGEGVQGGFADYILDGSLGGKIKEDCLNGYKFIMDEFEKSNGKCEAWLIGLSRGSYTVRCVGGMINNCGLISRQVITDHFAALGHGPPSDKDMDDVIGSAYAYYRDRSDKYTPTSTYMMKWKEHHSRKAERPPVKFMGLFETVGALGIPSLNPGSGVDYYGELNFYGKAEEGVSAVSGEVERVYQALAVHDRCSVFNPCHVKRDKLNGDFVYNKEPYNLDIDYKTEELWFPGAHYDLGRQKFMFYKSPSVLPPDPLGMIIRFQWMNLITEIASNLVQRGVSFGSTRVLRIPDIHPNYEYSNAVLNWMIGKMAETDAVEFGSLHEVMNKDVVTHPKQDSLWERLFNWVTLKPVPLKNDAYDHLVDNAYLGFDLVPFAHRFLVGLLDRYILMDRRILDPPPPAEPGQPPAPPVRFHRPEILLKADPRSYRSRSYDSYKLELESQNRDVLLVDE
ncbi:hypothetical protein KC19_9G171000 [Ceratodon purpureus]|uniref:T6SS Phospholipase effector Tle1-like catalytic domain-containing protein n=1 Tax=Ceratodon purpureus TaxID=3225 RepID=A0A8T0GV59_CERPU|nr:hypothetical protein KC19_9G171000 [Ceratodon purpureus]